MAAAIVALNDGTEDPCAVRRRYDNDLSVLRDLAERNLADAGDHVKFA